MQRSTVVALALVLLTGAVGSARASEPGLLDDAALRAYAARAFDKHALMGKTVELGRHHGVPVVAEFPCADVCPQYTVRIIHYRLADGADCASAGGVTKDVLVPVAITVLAKSFCVPKVLAQNGGYYTR